MVREARSRVRYPWSLQCPIAENRIPAKLRRSLQRAPPSILGRREERVPPVSRHGPWTASQKGHSFWDTPAKCFGQRVPPSSPPWSANPGILGVCTPRESRGEWASPLPHQDHSLSHRRSVNATSRPLTSKIPTQLFKRQSRSNPVRKRHFAPRSNIGTTRPPWPAQYGDISV